VPMATAAVTAAMLAFAPSALANPFSAFATCPLHVSEVQACVSAKSDSSSSFTAGNVTVPLKKPLTLDGGFIEDPETGEETFVGAEGGPTLTVEPQTGPSLEHDIEPSLLPQPLRATYEKAVAAGKTKVTATIELAGPSNAVYLNEENILAPELVPGEGGKTGLGLPTKVKLSNSFLGNDCYVGSNESPIQIDLTTGKSGAITGTLGQVSSNRAGTILTISGDSLVNNTYAAPAATGCGQGGEADAALNAKLGLPAGSGENTAIIDGKLKQASSNIVEEGLG
jgi:hypothetical protein